MRVQALFNRLAVLLPVFLCTSLVSLPHPAWATPSPTTSNGGGGGQPAATVITNPTTTPSLSSFLSSPGEKTSLTSQEETSYTVTFAITGEEPSQTSQTVQEGKTITRPTNPTRQGYLFDGWFIQDTNQAYDFTQPVTTNLTLTTHWSKTDSTWGINPKKGASTGGNQANITTQPTRGIRFSQVSAGDIHNLAISSDGNLYSWGWNKYGQLGDGSTTDRSRPVLVGKPAGVPDSFTWTQVSARGYSSWALGSDGNLYSWGYNLYGQLGDGTTTDRSKPGLVRKPTGVPDTFTWTQVSAGYSHCLAFGSDGNLYSWGDSTYGKLGDGTRTDRSTPGLVGKPTGVPDSFTWTKAIAGRFHSLAFGSDGNLYSWGSNSDGELGDGTKTDRSTPGLVRKPTGVPDSFTWTQVSAGWSLSTAFGSDGNLYSWGSNQYGQLGDGTKTDRSTPVQVSKPTGVGDSFTWTKVIAGDFHSLAFGSDGSLYSWGNNTNGGLGDGTTINRSTPVLVRKPTGVGDSFTWTKAIAGDAHSLAFGSDGNLYSWGWNKYGQLGDGTTTDRSQPVIVIVPWSVTLSSVSFAGRASTSGPTLQDDDSWLVTVPTKPSTLTKPQADVTIAWKLGGVSQPDIHLTYTYLPTYTVTFTITGEEPSQTSKTVLEGETITRPTDPTRQGYLFDGWFIQDTNQAYDFTQPVTTNLTLTTHWTKTDIPWTISPNQGPETGGTKVTLTPPTPRGIRFSHISSTYTSVLAFGSDGNLYSWGDNSDGQLGDGTKTDRYRPVLVSKPAGVSDTFTWVQAIAGSWHSLGFGSDGNLYSWGWNSSGQLGDGTTTNRLTPVQVSKPKGVDSSFTWTQASPGILHSLALGSDGNLYSWGNNGNGQLGDGTTTQRLTPVQVSKPKGVDSSFTWTQLGAAGWNASMAVGSDGNLYSWGYNKYGQLGDGTTTDRSTPVQVRKPTGVSDSFTWVQVDTVNSHSLAIGSDGNLYSWGYNNCGQLGDGTTTDRSTPVQVSKPKGVNTSFTWKQALTGYIESLALGSDGNLYGWGNTTTTEGSEPHKPSLLWKPAGTDNTFTWKQANRGSSFCLALGSDGNLYSWGSNTHGKLGVGATTNNLDRPGLVPVVDPPVVSGVRFGQTSSTGSVTRQDDGTWLVTSPEHNPGTVPVTISWKLNNSSQTDDTSNTFTYTPISIIPAAGGTGIIPLLLLGLTIMSITQLKRHQTRPTTFTRVSG